MPARKSILLTALRSAPPLLKAAEVYAPRQLIRKLSKISPPANPYVYAAVEKMAAGMEHSKATQLIDAAKKTSAAWSQYKAQNEVAWEIRESLCKKLSTGKLVAYGYETTTPKTPSQIPGYLFEHGKFIDWGQSSVKGNGLHYLSIRVLPSNHVANNEEVIKKRPLLDGAGKGGRPTSRVRASQAIWALTKEYRNFDGLPDKVKISKVRNYILKHHSDEFPGEKGLSDKTLGTHIRSLSGRKLPPKS